ncbi:MAG: DUF6286 domain-containing protein [Egibacteraceae bacterium]
MNALNRLLGLLVGLTLLGAALLLVVETVLSFLQRPAWLVPLDQWATELSSLSWQNRTLMVVAALCVVAGVGLVTLQLWPARPAALRLIEQRVNRLAALDGRGLEELLRRTAVDDGDVQGAAVRVSRRKARVEGSVPRDAQVSAVRARTRERVQACVRELRLERPLKVVVRLRRSKVRVR